MRLTFAPMTSAVASEIAAWTYEPPYDIYNVAPGDRQKAVAEMVEPAAGYFAISDAGNDELIGFCCFGAVGRVPGGDYTAPAFDVGIGLRPDLTGRGIGPTVIAAMLDYANAVFNARAFRATIAAFNERSQRAFASVGFEQKAVFTTPGPREQRAWITLTKS